MCARVVLGIPVVQIQYSIYKSKAITVCLKIGASDSETCTECWCVRMWCVWLCVTSPGIACSYLAGPPLFAASFLHTLRSPRDPVAKQLPHELL